MVLFNAPSVIVALLLLLLPLLLFLPQSPLTTKMLVSRGNTSGEP